MKNDSKWMIFIIVKMCKDCSIFYPISNNIKLNVNLNFWKLIKHSTIEISIFSPINWVFALHNPPTKQSEPSAAAPATERVTVSSHPFQLPGFWTVLPRLQADRCSSIWNCATNKSASGCEIVFGSTWDAREGIAFGSPSDTLGLWAANRIAKEFCQSTKILHHHQCSKCNCHVQGLSLF
jgi:hypothetical protein